MFGRGVTWLVCFLVGTVIATDYSDRNIITAFNNGAAVNRWRTYNPEWSMMESVQKVKDVVGGNLDLVLDVGDTTIEAGNTHIVAHRTIVSAKRPEMAATPRHNTLEASSDQIPVPDIQDPVLRKLLAYLYTLKTQQLLAAANRYSVPDLKADPDNLVAAQTLVEAAAAAAEQPAQHSSGNMRRAPVYLMKGDLGQEHTQPEEGVQQSGQLFDGAETTSEPTTAQTRTTPTNTQTYSGHTQTAASAASPAVTCPTTPLDDVDVSFLRSLSDGDKRNWLIEATKQGNIEELRSLLAAGAETVWDGWTALHWAAYTGHEVAAACLLDAGADMEAKDGNGYRPVHMAAMGDHPAVVQLLAARGADLNPRDDWGWTPLHLTVRDRHPEAAAALLEAGADREAKESDGLTPLDMAERTQNQLMVETLTQN